MATAAFKSSSRRVEPTFLNPSTKTTASSGRDTRKNSSKKAPLRRSRSVSAFSRAELDVSSSSSNDFLIKRDNPLFQTGKSTPDGEIHRKNSRKVEEVEVRQGNSKAVGSEGSRRGRSVSRTYDEVRNGSGIGRSLSRTEDRGWRHRSLSRCPGARGHYANSESTLNWEDGISTSSFSEGEEKTVMSVSERVKQSLQVDNLEGDASASGIYETVRSEVRRAISEIQNELHSAMQRSKVGAISAVSITDIPPDFVNPGAVELVLDIRGEYAKKLEQSQERARKLRADLAVEEHRGLELTRILKEVLPAPKASDEPKTRAGRKSSIERRKMSKRLTEEAMAYFDECVSLSTFDGSDFSSPEDPAHSLVGIASPASNCMSLPHGISNFSGNYFPNGCPDDKQEDWFTHNRDVPQPIEGSSSSKEGMKNKLWGRKFSFNSRPSETLELQQDVSKYVKNPEERRKASNEPQLLSSNGYNADDYNLHKSQEELFLDQVLLKSRLESGSLLLCFGGTTVSSSPMLL